MRTKRVVLALLLALAVLGVVAVVPVQAVSSVTTVAASAVGDHQATLNGNLTALGGATNATVGFLYGTSSVLTGATNVTVDVGVTSVPHAYSYVASGLEIGRVYYFRAWSRDNGTAAYNTGSILSFTTTDSTSAAVGSLVTLVTALMLSLIPLFLIVGIFGVVIGMITRKLNMVGGKMGGKGK